MLNIYDEISHAKNSNPAPETRRTIGGLEFEYRFYTQTVTKQLSQ